MLRNFAVRSAESVIAALVFSHWAEGPRLVGYREVIIDLAGHEVIHRR